jgi:hypothetical protein
MSKSKEALGWREWVELPKFSSTPIKAKVDTGARTSALHATNIKITGKTNRVVHFDLHPKQDAGPTVNCKSKLIDQRKVKSSNGISSLRPVIEVLVKVGETTWPIEITLVNREIMGFRMLLGRQALRKHFLVDPSKSFLASKKQKRSHRS